MGESRMTQRKEEASEKIGGKQVEARTQSEMQRELDTADGLLKTETMEVMGKER